MDYCSILRTLLTYLNTTVLHHLRAKPPHLSPNFTWEFLSVEDSSHITHRYILPDFINESSRAKEGHSWELFGDLIFSLPHPFQLHAISIGRRDGARLSTPWCRAFKSSTTSQLRFQKKSGSPLDSSSWKPFYFNRETDPELWVERMIGEGVIQDLVRTYTIPEPDKIHVENFHHDLEYELAQIQALDSTSSFADLPITRPVCDSPYVCQHQRVCYSKDPEKEIETCGLYERIDKAKKMGRPSIKI